MTTQTLFPPMRSAAHLALLAEEPDYVDTSYYAAPVPVSETEAPANLLEYLKVIRGYRNPTWTGVNAHLELQQVLLYIYQHGVHSFHRTVADVMKSQFGTLRDIEEVFYVDTQPNGCPSYLFISDAFIIEMTLGEVDVFFADTRTIERARISEVEAYKWNTTHLPFPECPFDVAVLTL